MDIKTATPSQIAERMGPSASEAEGAALLKHLTRGYWTDTADIPAPIWEKMVARAVHNAARECPACGEDARCLHCKGCSECGTCECVFCEYCERNRTEWEASEVEPCCGDHARDLDDDAQIDKYTYDSDDRYGED